MIYKNKILKFVALLMVVTILSGCRLSAPKPQQLEKTNFLLGTTITIRANVKDGGKSINEAFKRIREIEELMSKNIENTEISRINQSAGKEPVKISLETMKVIQKGIHYGELTNGAFDVTIGPLVNLWNVLDLNPKVPEAEKITQAQGLVNFKDVEIDEKNSKVLLARENMIIDLGGIAKGYAADEAARVLRKHGVKSAFLNLGGDIAVIGTKPDGKPWGIGIQDPRKPQGTAVAVVYAVDKTVVTSGDYERVFFQGGIRFHHIIDPNTGYPTANEVTSVTIVSDDAIDADALSTAVFVMGTQRGLQLIESLKGVDVVIIDKDNNIHLSAGVKDSFELLEASYNIVK